jgi:hypothetical protein
MRMSVVYTGAGVQRAHSDHSFATAVLLEKGGRFYVYQPGLALIASDQSLLTAYRKFIGVRRDFIEEAERSGLAGHGPLPRAYVGVPEQSLARGGIAAELGLFVAKLCIVLLLVAGLGAAAAIGMKNALGGGGVSIVDIANKAAEIVKDVQAMPPDRKESLRQSIGVLSREAAPLMDAWRNPPPLPEPKGDPAAPGAANKPGR